MLGSMQEQQEKVPKVVKNFDVMLTKYIGNTVVDTHPNMNESFRTLVHKKNKFYLLLWTLANGDYCRLAFKQKAKWARLLRLRVLIGRMKLNRILLQWKV